MEIKHGWKYCKFHINSKYKMFTRTQDIIYIINKYLHDKEFIRTNDSNTLSAFNILRAYNVGMNIPLREAEFYL